MLYELEPWKHDTVKTPQTDAKRAIIALGLGREGERISKNTLYLVAMQPAPYIYIPVLKRRGFTAQKDQ